MRRVRWCLLAVLFFLSATACWGGAVLIADAHGNPWGMMPQRLLIHAPFHSWLIPGILLFSAIGLLGVWTLWLTLRQERDYGLWSALQGMVLLGYLATESVLLRSWIWLDYLYGVLALCLILSGLRLRNVSRSASRS